MRKKIIKTACLVLFLFLLRSTTRADSLANGTITVDYSVCSGNLTSLASGPLWADRKLPVNAGFTVFLLPENTNKGRWLDASDFKLLAPPIRSDAEKTLKCSYEAKVGTGKIKVDTTVLLSGDVIKLSIAVENQSKIPILKVRFPVFDNLSFTRNGKKDELLWPELTTNLIKRPSVNFKPPVFYPRASVNFVDLSGGGKGLTFVGDSSLIFRKFHYTKGSQKGSIAFSMTMLDNISYNQQATYKMNLYFHQGNWTQAADFYRDWFYRYYPKPAYPDWVKYSNGYLAIYWGENNYPPYGVRTRIHINETWRLGLDHLQFWGQTGWHACPGYPLADPMRGGEKRFRKMFKEIEDAGVKTGAYFWSCGIGKYEVLATKYRGVKWSDMPKEVRPPSWDWVAKHAKTTAKRQPATKKLTSTSWKRSGCTTIKEAEDKKLNPQVLQPLTFQSEGYQNWLFFWIKRYVEKFHIQVPYLDVYGRSPNRPAWNPYLGLWGDGKEGIARYNFLVRLNKKLKPINHDFSPFFEGVVDCYNTQGTGLVSHFRRFIPGYRYTFPEMILHEGMSNGCVFPDKSRKSLSNAYLDGLRYDLVWKWLTNEETRMVLLRDSLIRIVADGKYLVDGDFKLSNSETEAVLFDATKKHGVFLINLRNIKNLQGAKIKLGVSLLKKTKAGFLLPLFGRFKKLNKLDDEITIPSETVSSILLVTDHVPAKNAILPFVFPEQGSKGTKYNIQLLNLSDSSRKVKTNVEFIENKVKTVVAKSELEPLSVCSTEFELSHQKYGDKAQRLFIHFNWSRSGNWFKKILFLASGWHYSLRRLYEPFFEDGHFEWDTAWPISGEDSLSGKKSLRLDPGVKAEPFVFLKAHSPTEITVFMKTKGKKMGRVFIYWHPKRRVYAYLKPTGEKNKNGWQKMKANFTTDAEDKVQVILMNPKENNGTVYFDDLSIKQ